MREWGRDGGEFAGENALEVVIVGEVGLEGARERLLLLPHALGVDCD